MFGRRVQGQVLTFGVSGMLRQSNLIMWDRETESWWQQGTFEAIAGALAGTRLPVFPSMLVAWEDFKETFPQGKVLSPKTIPFYAGAGFYRVNPYTRYDSSEPYLFRGEMDPRLPPMERVVGITLGERPIAFPFNALKGVGVVQQRRGGQEFVVLYEPHARSPLDAQRYSQGRPVGTAGVYIPQAGGKRLTFRQEGPGRFVDAETGSRWNVFGVALEGPLKGERLTPLLHTQSFWFYWAAVFPETEVWAP